MSGQINLADVFVQRAAVQPDHAAFIGPADGDSMSYGELQQRVESLAGFLEQAGVRAGSCVGLHYPSSRGYVEFTYALWRLGASVVPIPVELKPDEKTDLLRNIAMEMVITPSATAQLVEAVRAGASIKVPEQWSHTPTEVVLVHPSRQHPPGFAAVNCAFLRFTSGTTGSSKGVVLSHETIYDRIHAANAGLGLSPADRVVWLLSMSYHFAVSIVAYLSFGATIVLCKNHFGTTIVRTTARQRGTFIYGSPVHYDLMAHDRSETQLPEVRLAISTATALRGEIADAFSQRFGKSLNEAYGIIEVGLPCINLDHPVKKRGSVGAVLPAYRLRLKDIGLDDRHQAIHLKGPGMFDAYYDPWRTSTELFDDGWFPTGDLGWLDADGYLFIEGRSKEMINVAGMKFFPGEVESVLESHPVIAEACVYGHKDRRFGEVPYADVVAQDNVDTLPDEAELKHYCGVRLADFKLPERVRFVDQLVKTASGKVIREESRIAR